MFDYKPERAVIQGVKLLENADVLIGHNIISYDLPLLKEQYPDFEYDGELMTRLYSADCTIPTSLTVTTKGVRKVCHSDCMGVIA